MDQLNKIREAVLTYYDALTARKNGESAGYRLLDAVQEALGMHWEHGVDHRAAAPQVVADERKLPPLPQYFPDIVNIRADEELRAHDYATQYARAALQAAPVQAQEPDNEWRRLALQFDGHRMQAIGHLKCMVEDATVHKLIAEEFLSARPLSGEAVLAERIKALAPVHPMAVPDGASAPRKPKPA